VHLPQIVEGAALNTSFLSDLRKRLIAARHKDRFLILTCADRKLREAIGNLPDGAADLRLLAEDMLTHLEADISRVDPYALRVDLFGVTQFSNLYRDPEKDSSYFAKSRVFAFLEANQGLGAFRDRANNVPRFEVYGVVGIQSATGVSADKAEEVLAATGTVSGQGGLIWWPTGKSSAFGPLDVGVFSGVGVLAFPPDSNERPDPKKADEFHFTHEIGVLAKQNSGEWRGTILSLSYIRDPRFDESQRLAARVRLVISPVPGGSGLGAFAEGAVNVGKGIDEVRISLGIRLDAMSILRGLVGGTGGPQ
jgi:hypothetical protein